MSPPPDTVSRMDSKTKYEVGQEVRVFDVNGRRMGQPEGGWVGFVTKIGRTLFTVEKQGVHGHSQSDQYRIETGRRNDSYSHQHVQTLDQVERDIRERDALAVIKEAGFEIKMGKRPSLGLLEAVAETIASKSWLESDDDSHG